ncbi:MAG TPA: hypothetical protein PKA49_08650, partial [Tepidiformaceae bacterium]|nr:hypothetical protein [Tepidiformaceae bacterium]
MAIVVVTSATPGAGKTGVATAIARHYAYQGRPVRLVRLAGEGSAEADAAQFGSLAFAPGSASTPVSTAPADSEGTLTVIEADAAAANIPGAVVVLVGVGAGACVSTSAPAASTVKYFVMATDGSVVMASPSLRSR